MFWGLLLKANKKYTQTITKAIHLSQAALDINNSSDEPVRVVLTSEKHNYVICTLRKNKTEQVALDLNFAEGEAISFTSEGNGSVHLTGYLMPEQEDFLDQLGEEEESEEEVEESPSKKGKPTKQQPENKKRKMIEANEDESDGDSGASSEDDDGDDDEDNDDEDDEEEDESDDEVEQPKLKQIKLDKNKQNGLENGKVQTKDKAKNEKKQHPDKSPKGGEKILQGGLKVDDIRVGTGTEAKPGKKVVVYYEGRLKSTNKMFDSAKHGAGFKFGLGKGEVIRGWDVGVAGMKVGGKRRIICPPNMAYGAKGSPPVIPPNSTLVFEVELKAVH